MFTGKGHLWSSKEQAFAVWTDYEMQRRIRGDGRPRLRLVSVDVKAKNEVHSIVRSKPPFVEQICRLTEIIDPQSFDPINGNWMKFFIDIARQRYEYAYLIELVGDNGYIDLEKQELWRILAHQIPYSNTTLVAGSNASDAVAIKLLYSDQIRRMWNADGKLVTR